MTVVRDGGGSNAERIWWLRAVLVLQAPRGVFAALRDDSDDAAGARQEPVTAIAFLAGIAAVLASGVAGDLLDEAEFDRLLVSFWIVFAGGAQAFAGYWLAGGILHLVLRGLGASGRYRRTRHLLAYAAAPLALTLFLLWPVRLAAFGEDLFREGGDDAGAGDATFEVAEGAFGAWALVLLAIALRVTNGWSWSRALGACTLAGLVVATVAVFLALAA
jgi:hypothetical protein